MTPCQRCGGQVLREYREWACLQCGACAPAPLDPVWEDGMRFEVEVLAPGRQRNRRPNHAGVRL